MYLVKCYKTLLALMFLDSVGGDVLHRTTEPAVWQAAVPRFEQRYPIKRRKETKDWINEYTENIVGPIRNFYWKMVRTLELSTRRLFGVRWHLTLDWLLSAPIDLIDFIGGPE